MFRSSLGATLLWMMCWSWAWAATPAAKTASREAGASDRMKPETFTGLPFRSIGPAMASGRIGDIAIDPTDHDIWYVAVSSGGVWKTVNSGTTWKPIFDGQGSYSIGCVAVDPKNPLVVWVGSGENNSQRSVGYGDGLYKSLDGGQSWKKVGLERSEHIAKIVIDPRDSDVVYVAAQGPLWSAGGDRGLYKSKDGGKTWTRILEVDEYTGVTDLVMGPRDPDVMIAASYQRHRRVWTLIDGGPGSAVHKSTDCGATWRKIENGLPKDDIGRIGLAISPVDPDVVYAIVEAANKGGGLYRSIDRGENWEKRGDYVSGSPQYYQEIVADPVVRDRVYSLDTWMMISDDAGKTFRKVGEKFKHVDNHALWIDPQDNEHLIAGCDGGLYRSYDRGATWSFFANLPVTQFYKVAVDNAQPFYNIYGGTQDNNTLGGPSATNTDHGIRNSDWFVTVGGDGFQSRVDPQDPNVVYSQWQYGNLIRYDRKTGEVLDIQPQTEPGGLPLRWNWDSPLIISPHSGTRLYFAANRLFRSEDRGNSWQAASPDLTRQLDRNKMEIMGRVWSVDAVAKNASTSFYGNLVALSESPAKEGLIYVGTDDGLVQVTEDGGATWRKIDRFPGVPELSYVSRLEASRHDDGVIYAAFDHHKMGDFKPYVLKSTDRGKSWRSISANLPERGTVYALAEDPVRKGLLFAGTEFGVFFTLDDGLRWTQLKGGIPVIAVRDLAIQERETDLVAATFGRGFYVLDDYTPLRTLAPEMLDRRAELFAVKNAKLFVPASPLGLREKGNQGDGFYVAANPAEGATFTYYLKDEIKTRKARRQESEKEIAKKGGDVLYPSWDSLRTEAREEAPTLVLTVTDSEGAVVRRLAGPVTAGFHRVNWDLRYPAADPTSLAAPDTDNPYASQPIGPLATAGSYQVSMALRADGKLEDLGQSRTFTVQPMFDPSLPRSDSKELATFQKKTSRLQRAVLAAVSVVRETEGRVAHLKKAIQDTPAADPALRGQLRGLELDLAALKDELSGDDVLESRNEPTPPSIVGRVQSVVFGHWYTTNGATHTHQRAYETAAGQFQTFLPKLRKLVEDDLARLEREAESAGAPWTPGRVPVWTPE